MIKKLLVLTTVLLLAMTSFTVGVFAWFTLGTQAEVEQFTGQVINFDLLDIEADFEFKFLIPDLDGIAYLHNDNLNSPSFSYRSYATTLYIEVTNVSDINTNVKARMKLAANTIPGQYAGVEEGLLFVSYNSEEPYPTFGGSSYAQTIANMTSINNAGINVNAGQTVIVAIDIWGYYDGLKGFRTFDDEYDLSEVFYSLIYRGIITLSLS